MTAPAEIYTTRDISQAIFSGREAPQGQFVASAFDAGAPERDGDGYRFVFSREIVDRDRTVIVLRGEGALGLSRFVENPVALYQHSSSHLGVIEDIGVRGDLLDGRLVFDPSPSNSLSRSVREYTDWRISRGTQDKGGATSIGFVPGANPTFVEVKAPERHVRLAGMELVEISYVYTPSNPDALKRAKAAGVDFGPVLESAEATLRAAGYRITPPPSPEGERIAKLEAEIAELRALLDPARGLVISKPAAPQPQPQLTAADAEAAIKRALAKISTRIYGTPATLTEDP